MLTPKFANCDPVLTAKLNLQPITSGEISPNIVLFASLVQFPRPSTAFRAIFVALSQFAWSLSTKARPCSNLFNLHSMNCEMVSFMADAVLLDNAYESICNKSLYVTNSHKFYYNFITCEQFEVELFRKKVR